MTKIHRFVGLCLLLAACGSDPGTIVPSDTLQGPDISPPSDVSSVDALETDVVSSDTQTSLDTVQPVDAVPVDSGTPDTTADVTEEDTQVVDTALPPVDTIVPPEDVSNDDDPSAEGAFGAEQTSAEVKVGEGFFATTLPLVIYKPEGIEAQAIVVWLHGMQLAPSDYLSYGKHLASWGYLVVMPQLPASVLQPTSHKQLKEHVMAVLDWIEETPGLVGAGVDPAQVGIAGHSLGGKLGLLTATTDARVKAVFAVDPVDSGPPPFIPSAPGDYPSVTPELMGDILQPVIYLGETLDAAAGITGQACAPAEDNFKAYYDHAAGDAMEIELLGASHMAFLDNPNCGLACSACKTSEMDTDLVKTLTRKYMTAFFQIVLRGDDAMNVYLVGDPIMDDADAGLLKWKANTQGF